MHSALNAQLSKEEIKETLLRFLVAGQNSLYRKVYFSGKYSILNTQKHLITFHCYFYTSSNIKYQGITVIQ